MPLLAGSSRVLKRFPLLFSTNQLSPRSKRSWRLLICTRHPHALVRLIGSTTSSSSSSQHAVDADTDSAASAANEQSIPPFPTHPRPTPHQIFHLPPTATSAEIKSRYYELMKLYHPDSAQSLRRKNKNKNKKENSSDEVFLLTSDDVRRERLNAIRMAYDALQGVRQQQQQQQQRHHHQYWGPYSGRRTTSGMGMGRRKWTGKKNEWGGFEYEPDIQPHPDGLTEPFILSKHGVMMCLVVIVASTVLSVRLLYISPTSIAARHHDEARFNLEEARRLGREHGKERRKELRKWIDEGGMKGFGANIGHGGPRPSPEHYDSTEGDEA